ncbi:hypothetical protein C4O09_005082 [Salmonella enterica subsp. enterica serovar Minnesota]|nr:hypothetical protein [Salmonella enterica subsp. enterica serovar Minnesota]
MSVLKSSDRVGKNKPFLIFGAVAEVNIIRNNRSLKRCKKIMEEEHPKRVFLFNNFMNKGCQHAFVLENLDCLNNMEVTGIKPGGFLAGNSFFGLVITDDNNIKVLQYQINNRIHRYFREHMKISDSHPAKALKTFTKVNLWCWKGKTELYRLWEDS